MKFNYIATTLVVICVFSLSFADVSVAQRGGPGGFLGGNNGWMGLLRNDAVVGEIELVDDQREEIETIQDELRQEMRERMMEMRDVAPEDRREMFTELREEMEDRQNEVGKEIEKVLMPMQLKRLKELEVQRTAQRNGRGSMGALANEDILEDLGVSDKQKEKLEKKALELKKKIEERIKKMTAEAEEELLSVLTSDQRKKFREKVGKTFDFGDDNRQGRDRRGRGGDRRDRDRDNF